MNSIKNEREPIIVPHLPHDLGNLPLDLFKVIHLKLNPMHTELFATVSKTWQSNRSVIARDEFLLIKPFIDWLNLNLSEKEEETKNKLLACYDVNESFKSITKQIRAVLQELDKETLMELEALSIKDEKPKFFKDSLHLALIDKKLKWAMEVFGTNHERLYVSYGFTSSDLATGGYFYKSMEVAEMITTDYERDCALMTISKEFFRDRLFNQTKNLLLKMSDKSARNHLTQYFINILVKHNETQIARNYMSILFY